MKPAFTDSEFLEWAETKPKTETFDGVNNYTCPIAQFLNETGRSKEAFVLSEEWYDDAILLKRGRKPQMHRLPPKSSKASMTIQPVNTFAHLVVRLKLLLEKRNVNDYYFEMR